MHRPIHVLPKPGHLHGWHGLVKRNGREAEDALQDVASVEPQLPEAIQRFSGYDVLPWLIRALIVERSYVGPC